MNSVLWPVEKIIFEFLVTVGQISHTIFGVQKIMLIASYLEWLTCLFLFIRVEFEKVLYSPDLKIVLIFLVTKVFQKGTMFK